MKKILLALIILSLVSCKTPEEKLQDKFISNATHFITQMASDEISEVKIVKTDTITDKKELLFITNTLIMSIEQRYNLLNELKDKWGESTIKYKEYGSIDKSGFWLKKLNDDYSAYTNLKSSLDLLNSKSIEFQNRASKSKSNKILGYYVALKYKSKDKFGIVKHEEITLPFYADGELKSVQGMAEELLKKYNAEYLIKYLN